VVSFKLCIHLCSWLFHSERRTFGVLDLSGNHMTDRSVLKCAKLALHSDSLEKFVLTGGNTLVVAFVAHTCGSSFP